MAVDEWGQVSGDPNPLHPTCFDAVMREIFNSEMTAVFQIAIGDANDIWLGLNTESDEQAGIRE